MYLNASLHEIGRSLSVGKDISTLSINKIIPVISQGCRESVYDKSRFGPKFETTNNDKQCENSLKADLF